VEQLDVIVTVSPAAASVQLYGIVSTTVPLAPDRVTTPLADAELLKLESKTLMDAWHEIGWSVPIAASMPSVMVILTVPVRATGAAVGTLLTIGANVPVAGL
jgi:hypothetical protein